MFEVAALAGYAAVVAVVIAAYRVESGTRRTAALAAWRRAAEASGVTDVGWSPSRLGEMSHLEGRCGHLVVRFDQSRPRAGISTVIVIAGVADITLCLEWKAGAFKKGQRGDMEVGDPDFDREVYVQGPPATVRAVLDGATRDEVQLFLRGHETHGGGDALETQVVVAHGELRAEIAGRQKKAFDHLPKVLAALLQLARRLSPPEDAAARLAHNARHEPLEAVRVANLITLDREYPDAAVTRETLRAACEDASEEVRLLAARALGAEGRAVLLAIAMREGPDERRAALAVEALGVYLPADTGAALLAGALRAGQTSLALACIESLGRVAVPESVRTLGNVLALHQEALSTAAARALSRTKLAEAEGPLLQALGDPSPDVRREAAAALASVGTAAAVLPLQELARREGSDVRRAARTAVAEIQGRLTGASPGQVSLSGGETGLVSLADAEAGRVSLPPD